MAGDGGAKLLARRWGGTRGEHSHLGQSFPAAWHRRLATQAQRLQHAISKLEVLSHQDREQLSSRQVAAIYDIRNPNQVVVWRCKVDTFGVAAFESKKRARPIMKPIRCRPVPPSTVTTDSTNALREENDRLRAEVAYLKKLRALIRTKRSVAPTKRG